jgi:thioredoxin reductase (NADPH)
MEHYSVVIIGSGPAGLTAALYTARADLKTLVLTGMQPGGQLTTTTDIENFPGVVDGTTGPELMATMRKQVEKFGAKTIDEEVSSVDFKNNPLLINVGEKRYSADAVVIATGASARWLGVPGEKELIGRGMSACATCDAFFYKGKDVAVVGGGDAAMEEATFLTKFANSVTVIHRREEFRASKIMIDRAENNPKIKFIWNTEVRKVNGTNKLESITVENIKTNATDDLKFDGVFVAIGHVPNTGIFKGQIEIDEKGYVVLHGESKTNVDGVFVAGDVYDHRYRQAITAAGSGCKAAIDVEKYLVQHT